MASRKLTRVYRGRHGKTGWNEANPTASSQPRPSAHLPKPALGSLAKLLVRVALLRAATPRVETLRNAWPPVLWIFAPHPPIPLR